MLSRRRSPVSRLLLISVALATLISGYYLGQYWQRQPLAELSAVVYPDGRPIDYPAELADDAEAPWRLFIVADTHAEDCATLPRHYALVINRLAAWPAMQQRLRLTILAYDQPDAAGISDYAAGLPWLDVLSLPATQLDPLASTLGIAPTSRDWCTPTQLNAILVSPAQRRWALIPYEQAADMAHNIHAIITFVEK